jgi:hypothetical protein
VRGCVSSGDLSHRVFRQGCQVRYAFIAEHRPVFSVRAMCRCLRIHPALALAGFWMAGAFLIRLKSL